MLTIYIGIGTGDTDINTERRDLGNDKTITGSTQGEVNYTSARVQMTFERGRFTITPRLSHKDIDIDVDAFTEIVPDDASGSAIWNANVSDVDAAACMGHDIEVHRRNYQKWISVDETRKTFMRKITLR